MLPTVVCDGGVGVGAVHRMQIPHLDIFFSQSAGNLRPPRAAHKPRTAGSGGIITGVQMYRRGQDICIRFGIHSLHTVGVVNHTRFILLIILRAGPSCCWHTE